MVDKIQLLPDHVANQIAAGEVVQRPSSVVKELLENAIDAGAKQIKLIIKDAGKSLIQVIDNGEGMSVTDARLCFDRHATSKIKTAEDLFQLYTKGFRGEALASIAAVAHVELKTKTPEAELGTSIKIEASEIIQQEMTVTPTGTSIAVKNLFFNIPARRNFLKSNPIENRHIIDEFQRVALAHPDVNFTMITNGIEVYKLHESNLRQRIVAIFGGKTNEKIVPVNEQTPIVKIYGFVYKPEFSKKGRSDQFFFANHRFIKSGYLHHAVVAAFEGLIKDGFQPGYFLFLEVNPSTIDINIHPTKTEIKFEDENTLYAMLRAAIKHSLGLFNIAPILDFDRDKNLDMPYEYKDKSVQFPQIEVDPDFNPFAHEKQKPKQKDISFPFKREKIAGWESLYTTSNQEQNEKNTQHLPDNQIEFESEVLTGSLFKDDLVLQTQQSFQVQQKYLILPIKEGVIVIHQHRAHQCILYEELLSNMTIKKATSQRLLFPLELSFTKNAVAILQEIKEQMEFTGFEFESIRKDKVVLTGLPPAIDENETKQLFERLIEDLQQDVPQTGFSQNDRLAKSMAKSIAIKTGVSLQKEQQEHIVNSLFACKEPHITPDNKPVFITISSTEWETKFNL